MVPSCQAGKHITGDETVLSVKGALCYQLFCECFWKFTARNKAALILKVRNAV